MKVWYEVEYRYRVFGKEWFDWSRFKWWDRVIYDDAWIAKLATEDELKNIPPNYEMELRIVKVTETREVEEGA
jgi:hypothetical protein